MGRRDQTFTKLERCSPTPMPSGGHRLSGAGSCAPVDEEGGEAHAARDPPSWPTRVPAPSGSEYLREEIRDEGEARLQSQWRETIARTHYRFPSSVILMFMSPIDHRFCQ